MLTQHQIQMMNDEEESTFNILLLYQTDPNDAPLVLVLAFCLLFTSWHASHPGNYFPAVLSPFLFFYSHSCPSSLLVLRSAMCRLK